MHISHSAAVRLCAVALCLSAVAGPVLATDAPVAMPAAGTCELHVWPTAGVGVRTAGLGVGFGIIGALADASGHQQGDKVRAEAASSAFGPDEQLVALMAADPVTALHLASYHVIQHDKPLDPKIARAKVRHSDSVSPCYAELITSNLSYYKGAIYKAVLFVDFTFLTFSDKPKAATSFHSTISHAANLTDPRDSAALAQAGERFAEIYSQSFKEFAGQSLAQSDWESAQHEVRKPRIPAFR